jgi:hypothetical protein
MENGKCIGIGIVLRQPLILYVVNKQGHTVIVHCKMELFPARARLVSDIPAGYGKIAVLFFTVYTKKNEPYQEVSGEKYILKRL